MPIITISHEAFGAGRAVAEKVGDILGYRCISREVLMKASERYGIAEAKLREVLEEKQRHWWTLWLENPRFYRVVLQAAVCELAQDGNIVYHGRAGQALFSGIRHVLNVFVDTPIESRLRQVMARKQLDEESAKKYLDELDRIRGRRVRDLFKIDWRDPTRYDIVINTAKTTVETAARMIAEVSERAEYQPTVNSLQAMEDLTVTAAAEAVLMASGLHIVNLEVQAHSGKVYVSGIILTEEVQDLAFNALEKIPGVTQVIPQFVVTPPEHYLYADTR